jgi:hypothetical protein
MDECDCEWGIAGEPGSGDAVGTVLTRSHATLWYGPRCFAYSRTQDEAGNFLLRLQAVGRFLPVGLDAPVLVLTEDSCRAEQLIAPDAGRGDAQAVQRIGRALFADVARTVDLEARWP